MKITLVFDLGVFFEPLTERLGIRYDVNLGAPDARSHCSFSLDMFVGVRWNLAAAVSYTHLTLPTIYSV